MRKAHIYLITNPVGKVYVGSTINLKDRIYRYKTLRIKAQVKIFNSINKYGWDKHKFKVLHTCDIEDRNYYEAYYGVVFDCIGENGLNLCLPKINDEYVAMSEETKKKIGDAHRGKTISEKNKRIVSENLKKYLQENGHPMKGKEPWNKGKEFLKGELNPMFGVKRSDEWKKEHSERMRKINRIGSKHHKSKLVLDTHTGIYYESLRQASIFSGIIYETLKTRVKKENTRFIYI